MNKTLINNEGYFVKIQYDCYKESIYSSLRKVDEIKFKVQIIKYIN